MTQETRPSRRIVFQGLGALGVAAVLAGCGGGDEPSGTGPTGSTTGGSTGGTGNGTGSNPTPLASTSEVPVGGGIILPDEKVVLTQPTQGEFKAYSAICKHQGFDVTRVEGGEIICDVHGSRYDLATGEVTSPPAPAPLDEVAITVEGDRILAA
jgi:nitrite reductase/ring-hydroxylating ferredoxin subunit